VLYYRRQFAEVGGSSTLAPTMPSSETNKGLISPWSAGQVCPLPLLILKHRPVKPGHGDEFIGSRIIPRGLLADRDLLIQLGYDGSADLSLLRDDKMADRVAALRRQAYLSLVGELCAWMVLGYGTAEASGLLARIYREQSGGTQAVRTDRKQRRARLREALCELKADNDQDPQLRKLAATTLELLGNLQRS
jgi:hypothetical protein